MRGGVVRGLLAVAALLALFPAAARAQEGQITGTVRDTSDALMPGVTVEVTSPALIERVRSSVTDSNGAYRITNLPVGTYKVSFSLAGFKKEERDGINLTSGFTASVNSVMTVGQVTETVVVSGAAPVVDVANAREVVNLQGEDIKALPTARNVNNLLELTAGIGSNYRPTSGFGSPSICVGGIGVFCNPSLNGFNVGDLGDNISFGGDQTNLQQGRVLVDGAVVNTGGGGFLGGMTGGYTADIANAQEVNIKLSGALGESETGGSEINIVPRTGGNRYSGDLNATYTKNSWFSENFQNYPNITSVFNAIIDDHDLSAAFGGPIKRDKLWFYTVGRDQGIHKRPSPPDFWPNLWEGKGGFNYQPDRGQPSVTYKNVWRNVNARITWQASAKNKFNFFWDEQDFCQDPCHGVVSGFTSPESWGSNQIHPNRLKQASWTSPLTRKILLEAGVSITNQVLDNTRSLDYVNHSNIPRVSESGDTAGGDSVASRVNQSAGNPGFALTSGSLNNALGGLFAAVDTANYRMRGSVSYITGGHHAKVGYDGAYYRRLTTNVVNDPLLTYNYTWPGVVANCAIGACGNTSLQFPTDPLNTARRPVPASVDIISGAGTLDEHVRTTAFYGEDQWTWKRFTLSAAVRYDHATSGYGSTCLGADRFTAGWCTPAADGVRYNDLTPRWGVVWDVRGDGKTSVKWNMGKYLNAASIGGLYASLNPAGNTRSVNTVRRNWTDTNGNRVVDCNLLNPADVSDGCGTFVFGFNDTARFGKDPLSLDAAGSAVGLNTVACGQTQNGIGAALRAYCNQYGGSLIDGWGKRRSEWQFGLGIQREILPRLSAEFVYNRRNYFNILVNDQLGVGCDQFNGLQAMTACQDGNLAYTNPSYDFYTVTAPSDPRLPNGGGYKILGLNDIKGAAPVGPPTAQTFLDGLNYTWNGFDTNFAWRGPGGIRIQGGTSTGRTQRDTCHASLDAPNVRGREGAEYLAGCKTLTPWQTTVKGSMSYTIPKVDVLVSTVFQSQPGTELTANVTYDKSEVAWNPASASRAAVPCATAALGTGCFNGVNFFTVFANTVSVPLYLNNEAYGPRIQLWDLKIAKNIRFAGKRLTLGADIYNMFNSDGITQFNATYTRDNPATPAVEVNHWLEPILIAPPRFVRGQITFNF
jgi:Carboxypeptidase regulatory-like domain